MKKIYQVTLSGIKGSILVEALNEEHAKGMAIMALRKFGLRRPTEARLATPPPQGDV